MNWKKLTMALACVSFVSPLAVRAGTQSDLTSCAARPIADFLSAQGTQSTFFPPVPDYVGWVGADFATFALVDYAGVADAYVQGQPGGGNWQPWTVVQADSGILECALPSGRAEIRVRLKSENAMGFAQSVAALIENNFDFLNTPTVFGDKVQGVPGKWAFGSAELWTTFTISEPGAALPDFYNVVNQQEPNGKLTYGPVTLNVHSETQGPTSDPRCLKVQQAASTSPNGKSLVFSPEIVEIDPEPCP